LVSQFYKALDPYLNKRNCINTTHESSSFWPICNSHHTLLLREDLSWFSRHEFYCQFIMILWRTFIFSDVETNSLLPESNAPWYLLLSNGCNPSITFFGNSTPPWYVTINNSMHCDWRICFLSTDQMRNKALWTSFLFKHGSWCVSFTCLSFCSCKMTSQTVEEKTMTNKPSLVPFLFLYFPFLLQFILHLFLFFLLLFSPSAYVDPYWLFLVS